MEDNIAIKVSGVSKTFRIPHEKISSLRGAAVSVFSKKRGYEEFKALDDVSFEVKKGEFFGIIGRNGSGKSTLLKILAGIYQPDDVYPVKSRLLSGAKHLTGGVKINGRISPFLELGIGFNPELSGRDNVYLNATVLGLTKKEIDKKFDSIVKFSELERFIDQKLKNYSSGMQVRLAFSVSIHANREILLMDEVLAVGDSNFQRKCLLEFNKYRELGKTVILVTHDIAIVQRYCDRVMLIRNGSIVKIGNADEVGDAYIFQNISDHEEIVDNENGEIVLESKRIGVKPVEIIKVGLYDSDGKEIKNISTYDYVEVRIFLGIKNNFDNEINIGLSIESMEGDYLFGYTTEADNFKIFKGSKYVSFKIKNTPLLHGEYCINVTLYGKDSSDIFDFRPKVLNFGVFSLKKEKMYKGYLSIKHDWGY